MLTLENLYHLTPIPVTMTSLGSKKMILYARSRRYSFIVSFFERRWAETPKGRDLEFIPPGSGTDSGTELAAVPHH